MIISIPHFWLLIWIQFGFQNHRIRKQSVSEQTHKSQTKNRFLCSVCLTFFSLTYNFSKEKLQTQSQMNYPIRNRIWKPAGLLRAAHYGTKPGHFETSKIHFPTSEGVSKVSERANEWAVRANGRASGPMLTSGFLVDLAHSAIVDAISTSGSVWWRRRDPAWRSVHKRYPRPERRPPEQL